LTPDAALAALRARGDAQRAAKTAAYHKTGREVLGVSNPEIDALARDWRAQDRSVEARTQLAVGLWETGMFEARIAAAKLLTQARIRGDGPVWDLIRAWVPDFDGWAIADAVASAGQRRLSAAPVRLDDVEPWTRSEHLWTRRAALVFTLPWAKGRHLSEADAARRDRILGWAGDLAGDRDRFLQKSLAGWLRTLGRHDPERVRAFLDAHGAAMKPFAVREVANGLS
jgi:3-methyladenine DNA glycosylase AlkD